jgi:hypothetical protein
MKPHAFAFAILAAGPLASTFFTHLAMAQATEQGAEAQALTAIVAPSPPQTWPVTVTEAVISAEISGQRITAMYVDLGNIVPFRGEG